MKKAEDRRVTVEIAEELPEEARTTRTNGAGVKKKSASKKAKAKQPTERITPASIFRKLIAFAKVYQIENEQDFREAARIYSEEAALIDQMRKTLKEDGLCSIWALARQERFDRGFVTLTGYREESGRLIDDEECIVLIEDNEPLAEVGEPALVGGRGEVETPEHMA